MTIGQVDTSGQISLGSIQNMDVETALMAVQCNRANLLETQLKGQIEGVQTRNNKIAKLNQLMSALNKAAGAFGSNAKSDSTLLSGDGNPGYAVAKGLCDEIRAAAKEADIKSLDVGYGQFDQGVDVRGVGGNTTKGQLDTKITQIKTLIDSESNTQQMDMLRLQSLTNKRNEAYDLMSTFMKKCSDGRASIMSNMR